MTPARRIVARALAVLMALSGAGVFIATPAFAGITAPFNQVFAADTTGNIQIRGNTVLTCQTAATSCAAVRNDTATGGGNPNNNNSNFMTYVDVDSDSTTFDSSSSTVAIPSGGTVLFAALVWGGNTTAGASLNSAAFGIGTGANSPTPANAGQVMFKVPGSSTYSTITSTRTSFLTGSTGNYQGYADVTSQIQAAGNGSYTVANVQTATGLNIQGGWGLAIAYSNPADPPRDLTIFSGFGSVGAGDVVDFSLSGFKTPTSGAVNTTLGSISYEGDVDSFGDQMQLGNTTSSLQNITDALHAVSNTFDSVISDLGVDDSTRNPDYVNQLGFDAATFNVDGFLANGSTSADIRLTSASGTGETYYPGIVSFATDLYSPDISATKTVSVATKAAGNTQAGVAEPGDTLLYTVNATNNGADAAVSTVLTDTIPAGTTYLAGSLTYGGTALTDITGDDVGSYNSGTNQVTINVGTGGTSSSGGGVATSGSILPVTFEVTVNSNIADGATIPNTASFAYSGSSTGIAVTGASNAVTTPAVLHHSALSITKTANVAGVYIGAGTHVTYTLTASNAGPYDDPGATITDTLPAGAVLISDTPSAGSCTTPAGSVVCHVGAIANGGHATVTVTVTLDAASNPATDTATVAGTNIDSNTSDNTASVSTTVTAAPPPAAPAPTPTPSASASPSPSASGVDDVAATDVTIIATKTSANVNPTTVVPGHGTLTITAITQPSHGATVALVNGQIVVTRDPGFVGSVTFTYLATGADGAQVRVTVTAHVLGDSFATGTLPFTGANIDLEAWIGFVLVGTGLIARAIGVRWRRPLESDVDE